MYTYKQWKLKNDYGSGFMVRKHCKPNIMGHKLISEECVLRSQENFFVTQLIHTPTEEKGTEEKVKFYKNLEQACNQTPKNDIKIISGDFTGEIGKQHLFKPIIGLHSKHEESSENGLKAIDFAAGKNMHINSTFFPHKTIHKHEFHQI
jgi:hypothetical protein